MSDEVLQIVKSVLASVIFCLVFVVVFSLILTLFSLPTSCVKPVNQVFKIVCIFLGGLLFIRSDNGLIKGAIHGVFASLCSTVLVFMMGGFNFTLFYLLELLIAAVAGAATGIIAVNIKKD